MMRTGKERSKVWNYFTKSGYEKALCNICKRSMSYRSTISNLKGHLERKHIRVYKELISKDVEEDENDERSVQNTNDLSFSKSYHKPQEVKDDAKTSLVSTSGTPSTSTLCILSYDLEMPAKRQKLMGPCITKVESLGQEKVITRDLLDLFIKDLQPISIVEDVGFSKLMKWIPGYELPEKETISDVMIPALYQETFNATKANVLQEAETVCITTDCWTSSANENYIAVTGHYITKDFDFKSVLLRCSIFFGSHTASNLAAEISNVVMKWNLQNKVNFSVSDNTSCIVEAIESVLKWEHYGCYGNKLNSIVEQSLREVLPTLEKIDKMLSHFRRYSSTEEKLLKHQLSTVNLQRKSLRQSEFKVWNSTFHNLCRFVELEESIKNTLAFIGDDLPVLTNNEWLTCKQLCEILSPFAEMTDSMNSQKYMTGSSVIVVTRCLKGTCEKLEKHDYSEAAKNVIAALKRGIEENFKDIESNSTFALCTLLDPRYKHHVFEDNTALEDAKMNLQNLVAQEIEKSTDAKNIQSQDNQESPSAVAVQAETSVGCLSAWSILNDIMVDKRRQNNAVSDAVKEIDSYFKYDVLPRLSEKGEQECPLVWWKNHEHVYPNLVKLFREKCNVVATSVPCKRLFSKTADVINDRRTRLTSQDNVEMIMFLNGNSDMKLQ